MEQYCVELYQAEELKKLEKQIWTWGVLSASCLILSILVCIIICTHVTFYNARRLLFYCVLTAIGGGWIALTFWIFLVQEKRIIKKHVALMAEGPREVYEGTCIISKERIFIKNGVPIRRAVLESPEARHDVSIYEAKVKLIEGTKIQKAYVRYGFLVAYEVEHE